MSGLIWTSPIPSPNDSGSNWLTAQPRPKEQGTCFTLPYMPTFTLSFQLVDLAYRTVTAFLDEDDATSNYRPNKPAQPKLKVRAAVRSQGENPSKALTNPLNAAKSFVLHPTWARVFLPNLMYLFFASQRPFQDFVNNSPAFVAIAQEALNATHPNISHTVITGDAIVTTVSCACTLGPTG